MFKLDHSDLMIDAKLWIFEVAESALIEGVEPEQYIYKGNFAGEGLKKYLLFKHIETSEELKIPCRINGYNALDVYEVDYFIIAPRRTRVISVLKNAACRPVFNSMCGEIPKKYLNILEKNKPELLI